MKRRTILRALERVLCDCLIECFGCERPATWRAQGQLGYACDACRLASPDVTWVRVSGHAAIREAVRVVEKAGAK